MFLCKCSCGKFVKKPLGHLRQQHTKSCGCLRIATTRKNNIKHGDSYTRLFRVWTTMIYRCYSKNTRGYGYYGSRGITVCDEWRDYIGFRKWALSSGYMDNLTIERKDNDGNYEPSNCAWITQAEQTKNSRHNRYVILNGERLTLTDAVKKVGIGRTTIYNRLKYMSIEQAFNLSRYKHYAPRSVRLK